jgi:nucleoside-diphosphate-sugar epimerase
MKEIAVTGAGGFVGHHLLMLLAARTDFRVRALVHGHHDPINGSTLKIAGDLMRPETLNDFLVPGCTVVNLVHLEGKSKEENLRAAANLAAACARTGISRFIHLSTAVVAGRVPDRVISEHTVCKPQSRYEITKLAVENFLMQEYRHLFEVVILRPTAVFGPGGENLIKLADGLTWGNRIANYLKSCLFNDRRMNLVSIANVVHAITFLVETAGTVGGESFIVSDDEEPMNNYRGVECFLMERFSIPDYPLPRVFIPSSVLSFLLRLMGRSNLNPGAVYAGGKLAAIGFRKPASFQAELKRFASWYETEFPPGE